jgi:hypothetical protein
MIAVLRCGDAARSPVALEQRRGGFAKPGVACDAQPGDVLVSPYKKAIAALFRSNFADCFVVETMAPGRARPWRSAASAR